ncbi:MAG: S41 family peptidase [Paludibacter sp.]|nr:S41 family peptidase [Paludibacter sp.]
MKKYLLIILFTAVLLPSCMNEPIVEPNTYEGNFESLWKIIDTKYCYLDYKHINWDSIHAAYKLKIDTVKTQFAFFDLMGSMLNELKDGHVNLYSDFNESRYWKWYTDYPDNFSLALINTSRYLGNNYLITNGFNYAKIANGKVGYIYYGSFEDNFSDNNVAYMMNYFSSCRGLIIDVRNNGGGSLSNSSQLASYFFKQETITGYIEHKTGDAHSDFSAPLAMKTIANKNAQWQRPVIVLTNRLAFSATNDFVNRMTQAPNALIVGDKTGGGGGLPISSELPNGWLVRFSASPMLNIAKQNIEFGIEPDYLVSLSATDQANGYDTIIEKAITLIK